MSDPCVLVLSKEKDPERELNKYYCSPQGCEVEKIIIVSVYIKEEWNMPSTPLTTSLWEC
jgi:hypothetical protein